MVQRRRLIEAGHGLELLSWMVAQGYPDVKVAVPAGRDGRPAHESGLCHEKAGIPTDGIRGMKKAPPVELPNPFFRP